MVHDHIAYIRVRTGENLENPAVSRIVIERIEFASSRIHVKRNRRRNIVRHIAVREGCFRANRHHRKDKAKRHAKHQ